MMQFSPVLAIIIDAYETTDLVVSSNGTVFFIVLAILNFPSVYLLEQGQTQGEGLNKYFKIAAVLTVIGQWGRYLFLKWFPDDFSLTLIPCVIMATGQPFLLNGISKHACIWFGDKERALAIGVVGFGLALGSILGLCLAGCFISEKDRYNKALVRRETENYMLFVSWGTTLFCLPMVLFY